MSKPLLTARTKLHTHVMENTAPASSVLVELRDLCQNIRTSLQRIEDALVRSGHDEQVTASKVLNGALNGAASRPKLELMAARTSCNVPDEK